MKIQVNKYITANSRLINTKYERDKERNINMYYEFE